MKKTAPIYFITLLGIASFAVAYYRLVISGFNLKVIASLFAGSMLILLAYCFKKKILVSKA